LPITPSPCHNGTPRLGVVLAGSGSSRNGAVKRYPFGYIRSGPVRRIIAEWAWYGLCVIYDRAEGPGESWRVRESSLTYGEEE